MTNRQFTFVIRQRWSYRVDRSHTSDESPFPIAPISNADRSRFNIDYPYAVDSNDGAQREERIGRSAVSILLAGSTRWNMQPLTQSRPAALRPLRAASLAKSTALLPLLHEAFKERATIDLVRALAVLGDSEIVPQLIGLLDQTESAMAAAIIDALGDLGGPQARAELRKRAAGIQQENVRFALRALARCATEEDENLYRKFAEDSDWYVRLACAKVLGRFRRADNLAVLMKLCNDPVRIVAQQALALIDG